MKKKVSLPTKFIRKRVALLLALVMVLSLLPMNVFGNAALQVRGNGRLVQGIGRVAEHGDEWDAFSLTIGTGQQDGGQWQAEEPPVVAMPPSVFVPGNGSVQIGIRQVNDQATLRMPSSVIGQLIHSAVDNNIVIDLTSLDDTSRVNMPVIAMHALADAGQSLELRFQQGILRLDAEALQSITQQSRGANLSFTLLSLNHDDLTPAQQAAMQGNTDFYRVLASSSAGGRVSEFDGNLSVTAPYYDVISYSGVRKGNIKGKIF